MSSPGVLDRKVYARDTRIFAEGSRGSAAYIVQSGRVQIWKKRGDEEQLTLGQVGPGGIFGEMALIDSSPRMASATAVEDTVCIIISEAAFRQKLSRADPFLRALINILVNDVRKAGDDRVTDGNAPQAPATDDGTSQAPVSNSDVSNSDAA